MEFLQGLYFVYLFSLLGGLAAVFTPYVYNMIPITIQNLSEPGEAVEIRRRNVAIYCLSLVFAATFIGLIVSVITSQKGLVKLIPAWIVNLFFLRLFAGLGISLLGAFDIILPKKWKKKTHAKATSAKRSVFMMAMRLPVVSFSSTAPIICLILLLSGKYGITGSIIGMLGFSSGLILPFIFPQFINLLSPGLLNYVKVLLGYFSLVLSLKFLSNTELLLGWNLISRELFIAIIAILSFVIFLYVMGGIRLSNDYLPAQNIYGINYVPIPRLFIGIILLAFVIYLIPGLWGAPLTAISKLLPPALPKVTG